MVAQVNRNISTASIPTFRLDDSSALNQRSSGGWLLKWRIQDSSRDRHIWVKSPGYIMDWGGESYAEIIASSVCKDFKIDNYTRYYPCIVDYNNQRLLSCYSYDFCEPAESIFLSYLKLFTSLKIETLWLEIKDYKSILQTVYEVTGFNIQKHFEDMLFLDYMICNYDRGWHNMGFIINRGEKKFEVAPIFDNGNSLDLVFFWEGKFDREELHGDGKLALPFNTTFENQLLLIRKSRVYRTDFSNTRRTLEYLMANFSEENNKHNVLNPLTKGNLIHITSMLQENYKHYKKLFSIK